MSKLNRKLLCPKQQPFNQKGNAAVLILLVLGIGGLIQFRFSSIANLSTMESIGYRLKADARDARIYLRSDVDCDVTKKKIANCKKGGPISLYGRDGNQILAAEGSKIGPFVLQAYCEKKNKIQVRILSGKKGELFTKSKPFGCTL